MRLSDVKGERAFEVLEILPDLIRPIAADPKAAKLFTDHKIPKGMNRNEFGMRWLYDAITKLIVPHRDDFIALVAAIDGITVKEYEAEMTIKKLTDDAINLFADEVFTTLFFLAVQTPDSSGSASEITTAQKA